MATKIKNSNAKADIKDVNSKSQTALHLAARSRNLREVKRLLSLGAEVDTRDKKDRTPLHLAANWNRGQSHYCTMQVLLENGACVNAQDNIKRKPLNYLVGRANFNVVQLLVNFKANSDYKTMGSAVCNRKYEIVLLFLDHGFEINRQDNNGKSLLHFATLCNQGNSHFDIIKLILKRGADVNAQDKDGNTPLHHLIWWANPKTVKLLLDFKADVEIKNKAGETPLYEAIDSENIEVVRLLLDHGSDVNYCNEKYTLLNIAFWYAEKNKVEIIKSLLKHGANTSESFCHFESNSEFKLTFFLKYTDINIVDSDEKNILNYISRPYNRKIILQLFAKLQALGTTLHSSILEYISENSDWNNYFIKCTEELKIAKNTKLKNCWVTFFNLLVDSKRKLKNYAGNRDLIRKFKNSGCLKKFPIYGELMHRNVNKGKRMRKLFDKSSVILNFRLPIFNPNHLIIRDIFDCLTFKDYLQLVS